MLPCSAASTRTTRYSRRSCRDDNAAASRVRARGPRVVGRHDARAPDRERLDEELLRAVARVCMPADVRGEIRRLGTAIRLPRERGHDIR